MRNRRKIDGLLLFTFFMPVFLVLVACQRAEDVDKAALTLEAKLIMTVQPESLPEEKPAPTDEAMEEPTQQVDPTVQTTPDELPVTTASDVEEFVSVTEFFSVKIPNGWSSEETFPGGALIMANSDVALDRYQDGSAVEPGDFVLNIGFLPFALFKQREVVPLGIQVEATPDVFLRSLLPLFKIEGEAVLSNVELVSTNGERDAGMLTVSDEGREGIILLLVAGDGVVALISTVSYPGEMAEFQDIVYTIASEATFRGAQDVLYGTFLGG